MALILLLVGPTIMIFLGLQVMSSVPLTFVFFYSWLLLIPICSLIRLEKPSRASRIKQLGLTFDRKNILTGLILGLSFLLVIVVAGYYLHQYFFDKDKLQQLFLTWNFQGNLIIWLLLVLLIVNPMLEELYWRGFLFQKLSEKYSVRTTIVLTSFCFSLYHLLSVIPLFSWPSNLLVMIPIFLAGMIWSYMRHVQQSLWGSIISHSLADLGIIALYVLFLR